MKRTEICACLSLVPLLAAVATAAWLTAARPAPLSGDDAPPASDQPQAVEDDMHEFMEYVFQPTYRRLKQQMAEPPTSNAGWKAIKSDALILAEATNLLMLRAPDDEAADWNRVAATVRRGGADLYRAAKAKDYASARAGYTSMIKRCNRCHDQFAGGEHQLEF